MKDKFFITMFFSIALGSLFIQQCQAATYGYNNPIGHESLTSFIQGLLISIQNITAWLAIIFIVIGGVMYLTAGGKDSQLTLAKNTIIAALIGFSIAIAGPSLLKEIKDLALGSGGGADPIASANSIYDILENVLEFVLTLVGILSLMSLLYSGFSYLSSVGDRGGVDKAKKVALYSVVALAVSGGSLILIRTIITFLST
jgi:hypothetical protein